MQLCMYGDGAKYIPRMVRHQTNLRHAAGAFPSLSSHSPTEPVFNAEGAENAEDLIESV